MTIEAAAIRAITCADEIIHALHFLQKEPNHEFWKEFLDKNVEKYKKIRKELPASIFGECE